MSHSWLNSDVPAEDALNFTQRHSPWASWLPWRLEFHAVTPVGWGAENLENWKPDSSHEVAPVVVPDFQKSRFSPTPHTREEGVPAAPRADHQLAFFSASLIRSAALPAASCNVAVDRCEYRCVTLGFE